MFKVTYKDDSDKTKYVVYDVTYDGAGIPYFLIYKEGSWLRVNAKRFKPV